MRHLVRFLACVIILVPAPGRAQEPPKGLRVYTCGHSFHVFVPAILADIAKKANIKDHMQVGLSSIGGSRVIQHWDKNDNKAKEEETKADNKVKEALRAGKVDVLTLSPIYLPDAGIENFVKLGLEHNPKMRITVQENWLPFDHFDPMYKQRPAKVDHNAATVESLRKSHGLYFKMHDEHVVELDQKYKTNAIVVAPVGQAVVALREKIIAGKAPGLKEQKDLFTDAIGHATPPLRVLVAYTHFASIYQRSPVGLPMPAVLAAWENPEREKLNRLLQEIAWDAVVSHPLSGVKAR